MKKHRGTRLRGSVQINKRITSVLLVLTLLLSCFSQFSLGYADEKYERHVAFENKDKIKKEIKVGEKLNIYAIVVDDDGIEDTYWDDIDGAVASYTQYKWISKDEDIATVKADGAYYQDLGHIKGVSAGTVTITVESTDCNNCEPKEIEITVIDDRPKYEGYVKINNEPEKKEIKVGEELTLYSIVADDKGEEINESNVNFTWESTDKKILDVLVDESDLYAANIIGISPGKATLKIENTDGENFKPLEIEIIVVEDKPIGEKGEIDNINIYLDKDIKELELNKKIKLKVIAKDITDKEIDNLDIKWEIEPKGSAAIDNGILSTLKEGNITVKATAEKSDKSVVESNSVSIKVIKLKLREEKIDEAIDAIIAKYKNPIFYGPDGLSDKYTDKLALALRHSGMHIEEINKSKRIFSTKPGYYSMLNTSRNIMTLIAVNEDPKKQVEKILDTSFTFYKDEDKDKDEYTEKLVNAIIALDMAGADYNKEAVVKALINKAVKNGDNVYFESYGNPDAELTAKALTAFSKHKDIDRVTDTINGIKKYLKSIQTESRLIESCSITCEVIQAIIALQEDPLDEYWVIEDEYGNKNNMVDATLVDIKEKILPMIRPNEQTHAAMAALTDLKNEK